MTFEEWINDKEFTQYVENGEFYALQKLCFEAGQQNCDCVHTDNSAVIERLQNENEALKELCDSAYDTVQECLEAYKKEEVEVTVDLSNSLNPNSWGVMRDVLYLPKESVRMMLEDAYRKIEKMKCCANCKNFGNERETDSHYGNRCCSFRANYKCNKWEMKK